MKYIAYHFIFISMGSSSQVWCGGVPETFSGSFEDQNYFHDNTKTFFSMFILILSSGQWSFPDK